MSLLNDASLVMIPSGYKDTKLYSVKPTNGDGDFTFSRGSNLAATRVNSEGLIEKGRENLLLQSNQFDTTWAFGAAVSVSSGQAGYDGSNDAWSLTKTATIFANISQSVSHSGIHTFSVYAKQGTNTSMILRSLGGTDAYSYFDLSAGTITGNTSNIIDSQIQAAGNGFYRCSITYNASSNTSIVMYPEVPFTGTSAGNILIQDAQLEQGLVATDYIETTTTTAQAGILEDMPRLDYSGGATCPSLLLEPQRSNVLANSEYGFNNTNSIITYNATTSPEGLQNAFKLTENSAAGSHRADTNFNADADTYTFSVFAKAGERNYINFAGSNVGAFSSTFNLSTGVLEGITGGTGDIEDYGNGWYRLIVTKTISSAGGVAVRIGTATSSATQSAGNTQNYTGDGVSGLYLYGYMVERGSYPTSYIPTYGSSVTRSADDDCSATSVSALIGQTAGTLFIEYDITNLEAGYDWFGLSDGTTNNRLLLGVSDSSTQGYRLFVSSGGTTSIDTRFGNTTAGGVVKVAVRYNSGAYEVYVNGSEALTTTGVSSFAATLSEVMLDDVTILALSVPVKQFIVFPTALTDAECEQLTTI